jgi:hypothetical protein
MTLDEGSKQVARITVDFVGKRGKSLQASPYTVSQSNPICLPPGKAGAVHGLENVFPGSAQAGRMVVTVSRIATYPSKGRCVA